MYTSIKTYIAIILIFAFCPFSFGQSNNFAVGGGIGFGSLMGNFPSQTTFGGKIFLETIYTLKPFDKFQISYTFAQKVEKFLPGDNNIKYYSYMHSVGFSGIFSQLLNPQINVEEGLGLILLNDRSFDDINTLNVGLLFSISSGINLSRNIGLLANLDYGLTFTNTNASYFLLMIQGKYYF
ncbi:MAG: hypothetical protein KDC90_04690 [Ignavibacteriae bacterium]|nr:hypothetical protein [Ignavibacteriota bacterium]